LPKLEGNYERFEKTFSFPLTDGEKYETMEEKKERRKTMEKIVGNCPFCGKSLEIPAELEEFSCVYCGKRSRTAVLTMEVPLADVQTLGRELVQAVLPYGDFERKITKKDYEPTFALYERENEERLEKLDLALCNDPRGVELAAKAVSEAFVQGIKEAMEKDKRRGSEFLFQNKLVLALFLTPLLRKLHLRTAEPLRESIHAQWRKQWPKEVWMPGDYEDIMGGFRKRKVCFITTAVCTHEGKADDCAELQAFRGFRDGWLTEQGGEALISQYYELAPAIVAAIDYCDDAPSRYAEIRARWLEPCYRALQEGRNADCRQTYVEMVQTLQDRYFSH
jgi:DNA-directed RNA polymerase subunit RPC12/RpoP